MFVATRTARASGGRHARRVGETIRHRSCEIRVKRTDAMHSPCKPGTRFFNKHSSTRVNPLITHPRACSPVSRSLTYQKSSRGSSTRPITANRAYLEPNVQNSESFLHIRAHRENRAMSAVYTPRPEDPRPRPLPSTYPYRALIDPYRALFPPLLRSAFFFSPLSQITKRRGGKLAEVRASRLDGREAQICGARQPIDDGDLWADRSGHASPE